MNIHTYDNYLTEEIRKRRACFYQNHFHSIKRLTLFYTPLILRIATDIILLRSPNFTDYWDYTNPLCLIGSYHNYAPHNTNINILNGYEQWKCDQSSRTLHFSKVININPIQDGLFWGCSQIRGGGGRQKAPPPKNLSHISYNNETWPQLYLIQRRSKKYMNDVIHLLSSADISIFSREISKFCYIKK